MDKPPNLRTATADELTEALSSCCNTMAAGASTTDDMMARATAERLVAHLEASGFVVMRKPAAGAPTGSRMPKSVDVRRDHALAAWIIVRDQPRPGRSPPG